MSDHLGRELTTMEYVILGLLGSAPQSGYAIIHAVENTTHYWRTSSGAVYPALRRLERGGIIQGNIEAASTMRPRKIYRLTQLGESLLDVWLTALLTDEELWSEREIPLVKFLFAEQRLSFVDVMAWLDGYERSLDAYQTTHSYWLQAQFSVSTPHQQLLIQSTQMDLDKQKTWIRVARERLLADHDAVREPDVAVALV